MKVDFLKISRKWNSISTSISTQQFFNLKFKIMKKIYSFLFAALATVAAVSCNKEVAPSDNLTEDVVVFTAGFDEATKTTISNGKSLWEANDKITVHNGTKGYEFTADMAGRFVPFTYAGNDFAGEKFMAVYPAGTYTADVNVKTVNANVPSWQEARANSWNHDAALAVAYSENDKLYFKNAVALIKFTVMGGGVKNVYFKGNNGEVVSGNVLVSLNADNTIKSVVGQGTDDASKAAEIYGESSNNYCFQDNTTYYLAVIPQNFANGFTIQVKMDGSDELKDIKKLETAYDLKPNTMLNVGTVQGTEMKDWEIAGTFNNWTPATMTKEGDYYVAKGVTGLNYVAEGEGSANGFKLLENGTWKGCGNGGKVAAGTWDYVWNDGGSNIYVDGAAETDAFDVYVNCIKPNETAKFVVVPAGTDVPKDEVSTPDQPETPDTPSVEGQASEWGVVGVVNGWGSSADITMYTTSTSGLFVAKNVTMPAGGFKIRANAQWNDAANYGLATAGPVEVDHVYDVITSGGSGDMTLAAGTYDIWFDRTNEKVYIMTPGKAISEAVSGKVETPSDNNWYLVGSFNGWNVADTAYQMTLEGDWYVFKNFKLASAAEVKFNAGSWNVNRGGAFVAVGEAIAVSQNGANIAVPAGSYDVYLNKAEDTVYFMTPGQTPSK